MCKTQRAIPKLGESEFPQHGGIFWGPWHSLKKKQSGSEARHLGMGQGSVTTIPRAEPGRETLGRSWGGAGWGMLGVEEPGTSGDLHPALAGIMGLVDPSEVEFPWLWTSQFWIKSRARTWSSGIMLPPPAEVFDVQRSAKVKDWQTLQLHRGE